MDQCNTENKQREINHSVEPWPEHRELNRQEEVVLNRLRICHIEFSHGHLMENNGAYYSRLGGSI